MNPTTQPQGVMPASGYAGDLTPQAAWELLAQNAQAVLVDVRTQQEWDAVGLPELQSLNKEVAPVSWVMLPSREQNPNFAREIEQLSDSKEAPILFLCKSGGRSAAAAFAMTQAGYTQCYNIVGGFEGPNGWKTTLPTKQVS